MLENPLRDPRDRRIPRVGGPVRAGHVRRDRGPGPQEAAAGHLRPGQPRACCRPASRWSASPGGTGRTRTSPRSPTRRSRSTRGPRSGTRSGSRSARASGSSRASSTTTRRSTLWPRPSAAWTPSASTGGNYAFYLSIPPKAFPVVVKQLKRSGLSDPDAYTPPQGRRLGGPPALAPGGHREAVRPRPEERPGAERHPVRGLPARVGVPHRPLPGQGNRPEHPGAALRQRDVRADLEPRVRGPRPDHDGRGHRHRRPGRLLRRDRRRPRRDPEPPAPAAGADRDGGAGRVRRRLAAGGEGEGAVGGPAARRIWPPAPRAASTPRAGRAASEVRGFLEEDGIPPGLPDRDLRRGPAAASGPGAGQASRSTCGPASGCRAG